MDKTKKMKLYTYDAVYRAKRKSKTNIRRIKIQKLFIHKTKICSTQI